MDVSGSLSSQNIRSGLVGLMCVGVWVSVFWGGPVGVLEIQSEEGERKRERGTVRVSRGV